MTFLSGKSCAGPIWWRKSSNSLIRILYFTRDYTTHDHRFLTALAKTAHQVTYLRLEKGAHPFETRPLPPEIQQVEWAFGRRQTRLSDIPSLLASLKTVIQKIQPDIIQAGPLQRSALLAALAGASRSSTPRLVSMSWGYDLIFDAPRNFWWRRATRYTLQHSSVMIGDCDTIRRLAGSYGMPNNRIVTFPWGIDLDFFRPAQPGSRPAPWRGGTGDEFTLLSTRSWERVYGVDVIAKAFVTAARHNPKLRLIMLGNGSQAGALRQIFTDGGVIDRVKFPGQASQADLRDYYQMADLYVSASHSDGTSISLLEAMACAKAVLVSDIPGNREWVEPGIQGRLFPDGDADALADALLQLSSQPQLLAGMGAKGRKLAEQRADWSKNFQQMRSAYEQAVA